MTTRGAKMIDVDEAADSCAPASGEPLTEEEWNRVVPEVPMPDICPA